jgi:hypothetical protein
MFCNIGQARRDRQVKANRWKRCWLEDLSNHHTFRPMHQTATEHWLNAGKAKSKELKALISRLIGLISTYGPTRDQQVNDLIAAIDPKLRAFADHYGPGHMPEPLSRFQQVYSSWRSSRAVPGGLVSLIEAYRSLDQLDEYADNPPSLSFESIFETHRTDEQLENSLAALVEKLTELVQVADENLSAEISRELRRILDELDRRQEKNLTNLMGWLDFGLKAIAKLGDMHLAGPYASIAYDCAKLAIQSKIRIMALYDEAQKEFQLKLGFNFFRKAADEIPYLNNEEDLKKFLPAPPQVK